MRQLKARVWDKKNKMMLYAFWIGSYNGVVCFSKSLNLQTGTTEISPVNLMKNYVVMQLLPLKDKYNKRIYIGDVLRADKTHYGKKSGHEYKIVKETPYGWNIKKNNSQWEVIGNIYQNPELTKYGN